MNFAADKLALILRIREVQGSVILAAVFCGFHQSFQENSMALHHYTQNSSGAHSTSH
jgi:hypothetical protein